MPGILILSIVTALGACVGSFLNVCIWRIPRPGLGVSSPRRSFCPSCEATIAWYDNIPIVSWFILGGRCRHCGGAIRLRYPFVEALTAFAFFVAGRYDLARYAEDGTWVPDPALFGAHALVAAALIAMSFIDIDFEIIPDELSVPGLAAAPLLAMAAPTLAPPDRWLVEIFGTWGDAVAFGRDRTAGAVTAGAIAATGLAAAAAGTAGWFLWRRFARRRFEGEGSPPAWAIVPGAVIPALVAGGAAWILARPSVALEPRYFALAWSLAGMALGAGSIYGVGVIGTWVFRKEAMGFGDVKLMGGIGGVVGPAGVLWTFGLASILGAIVGVAIWIRTGSRRIPFGPFLAGAAFAVLLWRGYLEAFLDWYVALLAGGAVR